MTDEPKGTDQRIRDRFDQIARGMALYEELRTAIGAFLAEFATFESMYLTAALGVLARDVTVVEYLDDLMDLDKRLVLLKRLAEARGVPPELMAEVQGVRRVAKKLRERRNEVAHGAASIAGASIAGVGHAKDLVAGVRLPRAQRKIPTKPVTDPEELAQVVKSWMRTVPEINGYTEETVTLQRASMRLTEKLGRFMRGEPWQEA